jgi:DNA-directed RNA polymerase subunit F
MVRKILEKKTMSIPEVLEVLEELHKKRKGEFDSFQESSLIYARTFSKVPVSKVDKIKKMLMDTYKLDEEHAIQVINIFPGSVEELRVIFEKDLKASKLDKKQLNEMINKLHDLAK